MNRKFIFGTLVCLTLAYSAHAQDQTKPAAITADVKAKSDADIDKKAADWTTSLALNDPDKESRIKSAIAAHLKAVRDWHNDHPAATVPPGINPATGNKLNELDKQMIADSAMPQTVHADLMTALKKDLTDEQVEQILDKYTIGKVAFTLAGYKSIVPDLTPAEEAAIVKNLKQAREQAIDYKNMTQVSAIFEIYKTKCEQYLNNNGRNWRALYKTYTDAIKAEKARKAAEAGKTND